MWVDGRGGMLSWLVDSPFEDPVPAGLAWLTRAELDGYYLLYDDAPLLDDTAAAPAPRRRGRSGERDVSPHDDAWDGERRWPSGPSVDGIVPPRGLPRGTVDPPVVSRAPYDTSPPGIATAPAASEARAAGRWRDAGRSHAAAATRARAERRRGRPWALRRDAGERALRRRAAAARTVARALAPLTVTGWVLLCDRRLAGTSITFDAVVVGPPGLLVVQARPVSGLRREPVGLVDGAGVPVSGDTAALAWATQQLVTTVAAALPGWVLAGYAALALVDPPGWTLTGTGALALARPGQLPALAGALPASLPPLAVTDLALAVEAVLLPAEN